LNPAFIILAVVWAIIVWFLCGYLFKPIGRIVLDIVKGAMKAFFGTKGDDIDE
jgi:hypothetical protein